jgi:hypothetical protein
MEVWCVTCAPEFCSLGAPCAYGMHANHTVEVYWSVNYEINLSQPFLGFVQSNLPGNMHATAILRTMNIGIR